MNDEAENISAAEARVGHAHRVERVLWGVCVLNLAVAAAKFFYGLASRSASMQADGIHSVFDSFANIVGLIGVIAASRPADAGHPYGHSKFETYGSVAIGVLLVAAAFEVGSSAVVKLVNQSYGAEVTVMSFVIMAATLAVNVGVSCYERRIGRKLGSEVLVADSSHTLSDAAVSIGVIAGLICVAAGLPVADPLMALIVMVFILISAFNVFRSALRTLSDHVRIPPEDIISVAEDIDPIAEVHCVRTRGTESEVYCDLHVLVDPEMTVGKAHALGDQFEEAVKRRFPNVKDVLVHIEPSDGEGDEEGEQGLSAGDAPDEGARIW